MIESMWIFSNGISLAEPGKHEELSKANDSLSRHRYIHPNQVCGV